MSFLLKICGTCITPNYRIPSLLRSPLSGIFSSPHPRIAVMDTLTVNPSTGKRRVDEHSKDQVLHKRNRYPDPGIAALNTKSEYLWNDWTVLPGNEIKRNPCWSQRQYRWCGSWWWSSWTVIADTEAKKGQREGEKTCRSRLPTSWRGGETTSTWCRWKPNT